MSPIRLGPYEIGEALGKGGMGSVYKAVNVESGERVAVKVLAPQLAMSEGFRERFEAEIDSLKTLRHEGIVRLYGWGEENGTLFYSMELVPGTSLEEELKAGRRFNWREVAGIAIQVCKALKHAHDHGIIHRDIKPANILLTAEERVKIADFGIARLFGSTQLTSAGGVLGTADYMSPEQADGRSVTARCDQYSLGGVMYALLAGRPPFRARSLPEMLQLQRFAEPEPVRRYAPQTPAQLEQVIQQLLSKDPANRFPNTVVLAKHLEAMTIALSRPTNDDFDLPDESPERSPLPSEPGLSMAVTQADPQQMTEAAAAATRRATVPPPAGQESSISILLAGDQRKPATDQTEKQADVPTQPAARFTTVEEDLAQRGETERESKLASALQWAALLAVLLAVIGGAWYATRPASADDLYATIQQALDREEPLGGVERQIDQFVAQFPDDGRFNEVQSYQRQLELERIDRRLRLEARRGQPLLPIERLYLQAMDRATIDPDQAIAKLRQLVTLFDMDESASNSVATSPEETRRVADCLALARRQLAELERQTQQMAKHELADLQARLVAAQAISKEQPDRAKSIYTAIVELYGSQSWAEPVVYEAKSLLEELKRH